jgi:hypothetical protein
MGQTSGTQTQTATKDPWSAQQPYLQDIFAEANKAYNSGAGSQYFPGSTVVPFSPDTTAGMDQVRAAATQTPFGLSGAQNVTNTALQGNQPNALGTLQTAAQGGMQNPFLSMLGQAANQNTTAGVNTLQQTANGSMLNANPYLDQMFNTAARGVVDNANAQFSLGGRYGSGAHTDVLSRNLGDLAGSIYGTNYANERQNQLGAANQLGALQSSDLSRNLSGMGSLASFGQQGIANQLGAANDVNTYGLNQTAQGLGAAQGLSGLQQYQNSGAQALLGLGSMEEGQAQQQIQDQINRWNFNQQAPWSTLGQYSGIIGGLGNLGGSTTSTMPTTSNPLMGAVGGASAGSALGPWGALAGGLAGYFGS